MVKQIILKQLLMLAMTLSSSNNLNSSLNSSNLVLQLVHVKADGCDD
jgi:hypothetical protein